MDNEISVVQYNTVTLKSYIQWQRFVKMQREHLSEVGEVYTRDDGGNRHTAFFKSKLRFALVVIGRWSIGAETGFVDEYAIIGPDFSWKSRGAS